MANQTKIEWTDATWNPVTGCSIVSPGCTNCYAMQMAGTRLKNHPSRKGLTNQVNDNHVWTGEVRFNEQWLTQPLHWKKPRMIFVCAHGDLFHEDVPDEWIDKIFAVMALCPQHIFQVLTKRPERMRAYFSYNRLTKISEAAEITAIDFRKYYLIGGPTSYNSAVTAILQRNNWPLPNVWLGVSVENQETANERIPYLLSTPAAVRFVSAEPLLGKIDLNYIMPDKAKYYNNGYPCYDVLSGRKMNNDAMNFTISTKTYKKLDWVITGGESGKNSRPMHQDWARSLRDQCAEAKVPFFFKQWGEWSCIYDRDNDDPNWTDCPKAKTNKERYINLDGGHGFHGDRVCFVKKVGKNKAGRLLDGIEHNAMPEATSCRICGCTEIKACFDHELGACWWVEPNLCSHCQLDLKDAK